MNNLFFLLLACLSWTICKGQDNPILTNHGHSFPQFNPNGNAPVFHIRNDVTEKLDSIWYRYVNDQGQLVTIVKSQYDYYANQLLKSETYLRLARYGGYIRGKDEYQYNNNYQVTIFYHSFFNEVAGVWNYSSRDEYIYHPDIGLKTEEIQSYWSEDTGEWMNGSRYTYQYNSEEHIEETILFYRNLGMWQEQYKSNYSYNDLGNTTSMYYYRKSQEIGTWELLDSIKYEYNAGHQLVRQVFHNLSLSEKDIKYEFTYNADGRVESREEFERWYSSPWQSEYRYEYEYTPDGLEKSITFFWPLSGENWVRNKRWEYTYTLAGDLQTGLDLYWDELTLKWISFSRDEYFFDDNTDGTTIVWPKTKSEKSYYYPEGYKENSFNQKVLYEAGSNYELDQMEWVARDSILFFYSDLTTGIVPIEQTNHFVFPNPTINDIHFHAPGIEPGARMDIYNQEGKLVMTCTISQEDPVSLEILSPGLYSYRIRNGKNFLVGKIMKE